MQEDHQQQPPPPAGWTPVGEARGLAGSTGRLHACVQGRYVSVLRIQGRLTCIDSICFHAGGPLTLGDIEDVDGKACLVCPWHNYKIDAFTGDKYYQSVTWQDGKMVPGGWKSNGPRHRVHQVEERADGLVYVQLNSDPAKMPSDGYAFNASCGSRIVHSSPNARSAAAVGADGKRTGLQLQGGATGGSMLRPQGPCDDAACYLAVPIVPKTVTEGVLAAETQLLTIQTLLRGPDWRIVCLSHYKLHTLSFWALETPLSQSSHEAAREAVPTAQTAQAQAQTAKMDFNTDMALVEVSLRSATSRSKLEGSLKGGAEGSGAVKATGLKGRVDMFAAACSNLAHLPAARLSSPGHRFSCSADAAAVEAALMNVQPEQEAQPFDSAHPDDHSHVGNESPTQGLSHTAVAQAHAVAESGLQPHPTAAAPAAAPGAAGPESSAAAAAMPKRSLAARLSSLRTHWKAAASMTLASKRTTARHNGSTGSNSGSGSDACDADDEDEGVLGRDPCPYRCSFTAGPSRVLRLLLGKCKPAMQLPQQQQHQPSQPASPATASPSAAGGGVGVGAGASGPQPIRARLAGFLQKLASSAGQGSSGNRRRAHGLGSARASECSHLAAVGSSHSLGSGFSGVTLSGGERDNRASDGECGSQDAGGAAHTSDTDAGSGDGV